MEIPKPLKDAVLAWYEARKMKDPDAIARSYEENGVIVLPTGGVLRGRQAIKEHYSLTLPAVEKSQKLRFGPRQFVVTSSVGHMTRKAKTKTGEHHSFVDVFVKQANGKFLFTFSSWTILNKSIRKGRTK